MSLGAAQSNSPRKEDTLSDELMEILFRTAKWAKYLSKVSFYVIGMSLLLTLILVGIFILEGWRYTSLIWFELLLSVLFYFPAKNLSKFSHLISGNTQETLPAALLQLKNFFRNLAVLILLIVLLFLLPLPQIFI
mgnify:CR=1 FL=1